LSNVKTQHFRSGFLEVEPVIRCLWEGFSGEKEGSRIGQEEMGSKNVVLLEAG
jgi:hypothetical protein